MTRKEFSKAVKTFLASSLTRRAKIQELLTQSIQFLDSDWTLEPLTELFTAIETIKTDDRRAILTWITHATGGYTVTQEGRVTNYGKAIAYWDSKNNCFKLRKLDKTSGETQEARVAHLRASLAHYAHVDWFSFAPEKTTKGYSFGLDAYLARSLANMEALTVKDREFLREVLSVAERHDRVIKGLTA